MLELTACKIKRILTSCFIFCKILWLSFTWITDQVDQTRWFTLLNLWTSALRSFKVFCKKKQCCHQRSSPEKNNVFFKCIKDKILLFCHLRTCSPYLASLRWIVWGSGSASPQPEPFFPKSIFHCSIVKLTNTHCCVMESTIYTINTKKVVDIFVLSHCWPFPPWDNFQQSPYSEGQSQSTYRKKLN